jgi:type I restriction enzyme R subunit
MSVEFKAVRDPIIKYLKDIDWHYLEPSECMELRGSNFEPFLLPILKRKLKELNRSIIETDEQAEEVIKALKNLRANIKGNQDFLQYLQGEKTIYVEKEKREINVRLIDFDNPANNEYHVTKEFEFSDVKTDRADIILFINGIPVINVETKSPAAEDPIAEAYAQIRRYHEEIPELMKAIQVFVLSDGTKLMFGPTWDLNKRNLHRWKIREEVNLEKLTKDFFQKDRILRIIEDYTIFFTRDEELYKFVLDQHQMRGVEKIFKRVVKEKLDSGLIWHTQGAGKTLTMIVAAHRLRKQKELENPTLIVIVDRIELEKQTRDNLIYYGFPNLVIAQSGEHLKDLLKTDFRGLIVTTIQKFEGMEKNINPRKNIIVLIDEAHRSQEGNLATYMRAALPNAYYFGFTGTPIDKSNIGKGTFKLFGKHDPQGYLDKYSIKESIEDGTTVPLYYFLAPQELRVNKELLEKEFFELVEKEGVASIEELDKILDKAVRLKNFLKAEKRVDAIAKYIADHYTKFVEPLGLKAFIVAVDREGCALYKQAIDRYLKPEYSRVVFTQDQKDSQLLKQFHISDEEETNIRKSFKSPDKLPKILIVTQKLLTGFDAPILYCMYLDKPLKDHTLLQAIARVNRPLSDEEGEKKKAGLIVDFVGILENLKRALSFDSATIEDALTDLTVLKDKFVELMKDAEQYLAIISKGIDDKTLNVISEKFIDKSEREKFFRLFKQIEDIFEILQPDVFLRDYLEPYKQLAQLYKIVQNMFRPREADVYKGLKNKTKELVRKHVNLNALIDSLPLYKIDEKVLERIEKEKVPEKVKIVNLYRSIVVHVQKAAKSEPYLYRLGDRAEEILKRFQEKQAKSVETLNELIRIVKEITQSEAERNQYKLTKDEFAIYWSLEESKASNDIVDLSKEILKLLNDNKNWPLNKKKEMELRKNLYKLLLGKIASNKLSATVNVILDMHRRMMER